MPFTTALSTFQESQVVAGVGAQDFRLNAFAILEIHPHPVRILYNVVIGDYVALAVDQKSGAGAQPGEGIRASAVNSDLHDRRANAPVNVLHHLLVK